MSFPSRLPLALLTGLLFLAALCSEARAQDKYAVLVSAGEATIDDQVENSEYWYDLILVYRALIDAGYGHDDIFVLYGTGTDFNSTHTNYQTSSVFSGVTQITDFAVTEANVGAVFAGLASGNTTLGIPPLQADDSLFFWWMGHGEGTTADTYYAWIESTNEYVMDEEFAALLDQLPACAVKTAFVMTCNSGGLLEEFDRLHASLQTAARVNETAHSVTYDVFHAEFSYHVASALREQDAQGNPIASDADGDGSITVDEVHVYAEAQTLLSTTQVADYRRISPHVVLANTDPAATVPRGGIYSRDYTTDCGIEPSDTSQLWFAGPDLWVRHADDGLLTHQNPEFGQTNHVYARVHNIGCRTLAANGATAALSWCEMSAWSNPSSWNHIAIVQVPLLQSGETKVLHAPWTTVPAPGKFCLHTVLEAPGDASNANGESCWDNNKVQINVCVEDNVAGWLKTYHWWIENGSESATPVDIAIDEVRIPPGAQIDLRIPAELDVDRAVDLSIGDVTGGQRPLRVASSSGGRASFGVDLAAGARHEAELSIMTPSGSRRGSSLVLKVSERVGDREMGGIVFVTRTRSPEEVMQTLGGRLSRFARALHRKLGLQPHDRLREVLQTNPRLTPQAMDLAELLDLEAATLDVLAGHLDADVLGRLRARVASSRRALSDLDLSTFVRQQEALMRAARPVFLAGG